MTPKEKKRSPALILMKKADLLESYESITQKILTELEKETPASLLPLLGQRGRLMAKVDALDLEMKEVLGKHGMGLLLELDPDCVSEAKRVVSLLQSVSGLETDCHARLQSMHESIFNASATAQKNRHRAITYGRMAKNAPRFVDASR